MGRHYTDQQYLHILETRGPDTSAGIATHLHRNRNRVHRRMKQLHQTGRVKHAGRGVNGDPLIWYSVNDPYGGM